MKANSGNPPYRGQDGAASLYPPHTTGHDTSLGTILKVIVDEAPVSRSAMIEVTGLASSTVSVATAELQRRGLIRECGHGSSTGGRRPVLLEMNPTGGHFLCADLSGQELSVGVLDLGFETAFTWTSPMPPDGGEAVYCALVAGLRAAAAWCEQERRPVLGIGVASPGLIDDASGTVVEADNLCWHDFRLRDRLQADFPTTPMLVEHDATAATYGEFKFGLEPGRTVLNMMVATIGAGVGAGLILNGSVFVGSTGMAGELGHVVVAPKGPQCACGNRGCLEAIAANAGVVEAYRQAVTLGQTTDVDVETVLERALAHDASAFAAIVAAGQAVGLALGNQVNVLNLDTVLVGGTLLHSDAMFEAVLRGFHQALLPKLSKTCTVERAKLGARAGLMGMAALSLQLVV